MDNIKYSEESENNTNLQKKFNHQNSILSSIMNATPDLIFNKDYFHSDGKYIDCNSAFEAFAGKSHEEIIGHTDIELFGEDIGNFFRTKDREMLQKNEPVINEQWINYPDGHRALVSTSKSPTYDKDRNILGVLGISRNITQRKKNEDALRELNSKLEDKVASEVEKNRLKDIQMLQLSRFAQMGEMINMIVHQWRQPLNAISATNATINLKANIDKLDKDMTIILTDRINDFLQHLSKTIDDFRGFFNEKKEKKDLDYTELIKFVLGIVEDSITAKNINIIQDLNHEDTFKSYANELKQVILNLIKNAEDILLEKEIKDPYIKISTFKENNDLVLTVSDNGGGIPEDIMDNIFDPYYSTKLAQDGTGLGLYMSKALIEDRCGGKLTVLNDEDGAVFKITLSLT